MLDYVVAEVLSLMKLSSFSLFKTLLVILCHSPSPLQSLQLAMFLYTVCHVVIVVLDSVEPTDNMFRYVAMTTHRHHSHSDWIC